MAQLGHAVGHRRLQGGPIAHVGLPCHDSPVELLDLLRRLGQVLGPGQRVGVGLDVAADVDRDDVGPLLGQAEGMAPSLTPGCSGDESDLSLDATHG